jgi:hypothetical protein
MVRNILNLESAICDSAAVQQEPRAGRTFPALFVLERVAHQTYAFFAFVCGSSSVRWISCLDVNIMVDVSMLRTAEEAKMRLPLRYPLPPSELIALVALIGLD